MSSVWGHKGRSQVGASDRQDQNKGRRKEAFAAEHGIPADLGISRPGWHGAAHDDPARLVAACAYPVMEQGVPAD